jgi:hypothetical protein
MQKQAYIVVKIDDETNTTEYFGGVEFGDASEVELYFTKAQARSMVSACQSRQPESDVSYKPVIMSYTEGFLPVASVAA